jgi:hypothetical protein
LTFKSIIIRTMSGLEDFLALISNRSYLHPNKLRLERWVIKLSIAGFGLAWRSFVFLALGRVKPLEECLEDLRVESGFPRWG